MKNIWTKKEIEILKTHWLEYNQRELHEKFIPSKTPEQIRSKKMCMGLKKPPVWTNEERATLLEYGSRYTHRELVARFFPNKTPMQVNYMRKHLGIRREFKNDRN